MTEATTTSTPTTTGPNTEFALLDMTGPAVVAGCRVTVGDMLVHDEYGLLEVRGYGWSNGALGEFLKLRAVEDVDAPERWSLDRGGPNSLPDAHEADRLSVGGENGA